MAACFSAAQPSSGSVPFGSVPAAGNHAGRLGGNHVLRDGCPLVLQLHLFHPAYHSKYQGSRGSPGTLKDPRARARGGGNLCESPGSLSEPGELGGREQEGQFLNAAQQRVIEGTRQGRLLEASITCDCLHFSFLASESAPRLLLLSFLLIVPGNTCVS